MDVFSLAIMNNVEFEDEFIILESYKDKDAERRDIWIVRDVFLVSLKLKG